MPATPIVRTKVASAVLDFEYALARSTDSWLQSGEAIASAQVIEATGTITISSITNTTSSVIAFVSGGVNNGRYSIDCFFQTTFGRKDVRSFDLIINDRQYR